MRWQTSGLSGAIATLTSQSWVVGLATGMSWVIACRAAATKSSCAVRPGAWAMPLMAKTRTSQRERNTSLQGYSPGCWAARAARGARIGGWGNGKQCEKSATPTKGG